MSNEFESGFATGVCLLDGTTALESGNGSFEVEDGGPIRVLDLRSRTTADFLAWNLATATATREAEIVIDTDQIALRSCEHDVQVVSAFDLQFDLIFSELPVLN